MITAGPDDPGKTGFRGELKDIVENVEQQIIKRTLAEYRGNVLQSSKALGLTYKGLTNKIKRYNIVLDYKKILSD